MATDIEIKGGAGPFEAAAIAAVVDKLRNEEARSGQRSTDTDGRLPAWVRALAPVDDPSDPRTVVVPD